MSKQSNRNVLQPKNVSEADQSPPEAPVQENLASSSNSLSPRQEFVQSVALFLFDRTLSMHELGESGRRVLAYSALLFDQPFPKGKKSATASKNRIKDRLSSDGLPEDQIRVLTAITALQQGKVRRSELEKFDLSPIQQREALTLAALITIAIGMDQSHTQTSTITQMEPVRGGLWLVVDGPEAVKDASAAQHQARYWKKIGYPEIRFLESSQARGKILPYPEPQAMVGMLPDDSYAEAGRKVMLFHFAEMLRNEAGTRLGEDIEALHDMRVATRRLRAAFEVFAPAFDPEALKPHLRGLRNTGRNLGRVRDRDVMLEKARNYWQTLSEADQPGMEPLLMNWAEQREHDRVTMLTYLDSEDYQTFKRKFNVFVNTPGAGVLPMNRDEPVPNLVREIAPVLVYTRLGEVRAYAPYLPGAPIERLHALRIEFKLFRYTVEFFKEVFCGDVKNVINLLKKIQDHLGDLNDADVARIVVEEFLVYMRTHPRQDGLSDLSGVEAYYNFRIDERDALVTSFAGVWAEFDRPEIRRVIAECVSAL